MSGVAANAGSLGDLQRAFQDYLLKNSDGFAATVRDSSKADRHLLLGVYREAYSLRLIEVLTEDYPGVLGLCGPDDFDYMARAYIAAHPSRHRSARWFGAKLADFLAATPPFSGAPDTVEMARFEWTMGDAFDAPDAAPIAADAIMSLPPEAWTTLRFSALPSLQRLALSFEVPQAWQRREEVEPGNLEVEAAPEAVEWVIWRPEAITNFRSFDRDEAAAFDALLAGKPFPEICEILAGHVGEEQALNRAAGLLRSWVEEGMLAGYEH